MLFSAGDASCVRLTAAGILKASRLAARIASKKLNGESEGEGCKVTARGDAVLGSWMFANVATRSEPA
jgi:hypothetical protein